MAHFSNGTEGLGYQEEWCFKCQHDINLDCVIWLLHLMYVGDKDGDVLDMLNTLIPVKDMEPQQCSMFIEKPDPDKNTVAGLKDQADKLMRDGKMTEAVKVFKRAWDTERTM